MTELGRYSLVRGNQWGKIPELLRTSGGYDRSLVSAEGCHGSLHWSHCRLGQPGYEVSPTVAVIGETLAFDDYWFLKLTQHREMDVIYLKVCDTTKEADFLHLNQ